MDESGQVTTIVQDHVKRLVAGESSQSLIDAPKVLLLGLALPGEHRDTGGRDAGMHL